MVAKKVKICFVGGGSYMWGPTLIRDIMSIKGIDEFEFRLYDIDLPAARLIGRLGEKMAADWKIKASFIPTKNKKEAFSGADFVLICIMVGRLEAMAPDLKIPEKYGIFQTVGDTVGPGGWARGLRSVPIFVDFARTAKRYCPNATVLNYTNPMAILTRALAENTDQPVVGLCHAFFETFEALEDVLGLDSKDDFKVKSAGLNHFFWFLEMKIKGKDGLAMLRRLLKGRNLDELLTPTLPSTDAYYTRSMVAGELFNEYGYLPYVHDRHIAEFFSRYIAPTKKRLKEYKLHQTTIEDRYQCLEENLQNIKDMLSGKKPIEPKPSAREIAKDIIEAVATGTEIVDSVNLPNCGQIPNLPMGVVVETMGVINSLGFTPVNVGPMPQEIVNLLMPHAVNQKPIVESAMTGDRDTAYKALINDPVCSHLTICKIKQMANELLKANKKYLPNFFKK